MVHWRHFYTSFGGPGKRSLTGCQQISHLTFLNFMLPSPSFELETMLTRARAFEVKHNQREFIYKALLLPIILFSLRSSYIAQHKLSSRSALFAQYKNSAAAIIIELSAHAPNSASGANDIIRLRNR